MKSQTILSIFILWALAAAAQAQCSFTPTISAPDSVLCPGQSTIFTTQEYDGYQWYRRVYPDGAPELVAGATSQALAVTEADLLYFFWVEATDAGCTEASPEVLLDGHVFLLPFAQHSGEYEFDPNTGQFSICNGDTMFLDFSYGTNVTWFNNGEPMPGETSPTLAITEPGSYTASGAPGICPDFILGLGVVIDVVVVNCTSPVQPGPALPQTAIYPNPAGDWLTVENMFAKPLMRLELMNATGQLVRAFEGNGEAKQRISLENLPSGVYFLRTQGAEVVRLVKK